MFLEGDDPPENMIVMVQKEVAQRIVAQPGEMSVLSVAVQYYGEPTIVLEVPKEAFHPVPKVESAVLNIKIKPGKRDKEVNKQFFRVVKAGYCARRKKLLNNLVNSLHVEKEAVRIIFNSINISENIRAQDLTINQWKLLSEKLA
jgi:16S rRNA (adenine1518-N6/adenine1519-N6)-dimethyltransferase